MKSEMYPELIRCPKHQIGNDGKIWGRPTFKNGLKMVDDDDAATQSTEIDADVLMRKKI